MCLCVSIVQLDLFSTLVSCLTDVGFSNSVEKADFFGLKFLLAFLRQSKRKISKTYTCQLSSLLCWVSQKLVHDSNNQSSELNEALVLCLNFHAI